MDCPVCNQKDLNADTVKCPNCQADLEIFSDLKKASNSVLNLRRISFFLLVLFVSLTVSWIYAAYFLDQPEEAKTADSEITSDEVVNLKKQVNELNTQVESLKADLEVKKSELEDTKKPIDSGKETTGSSSESVSEQKSLNSYTVKKGESLWSIAQENLGNGLLYTQIVEMNQISNPEFIEVGQILTLNNQ